MSSTWENSARLGLVNGNGDLIGFDVEATDGHVGQIDEASNIGGQTHLVVDTGSWIFGRKRMIPVGLVHSIDARASRVYVRLSKSEVKSAPDFDAQRRDGRVDYDICHDQFWP